MTRKKLSDLKVDLSDLHNIEMTAMPTGHFLIFRNEHGDILFSVDARHMYDADGTCFAVDLP